jgi:alpha-ribazole phosphatase
VTRLVLIRHGETDWNVEGRYQGQADPPLNERGWTQARQLAEALQDQPLDVLYASDLRRAAETAAAIGQATGLAVHYDPRLREIHQGEWQGLLVTEIEQRYPDLFRRWREAPLTVTLPGGESIAQMRERVLAAVEEIVRRHPGQRVALVIHKLPIAVIKCHYQDIPLEHIWDLIPPNAGWEVVTVNHP